MTEADGHEIWSRRRRALAALLAAFALFVVAPACEGEGSVDVEEGGEGGEGGEGEGGVDVDVEGEGGEGEGD